MAGPLDALERIMEEAIEGTVQRLFRPKLQPVQLAKAAARRMDEQQVVGPSGPQVPNNYTISLNPRDFEAFARFQVALQRELETYLANFARDHGWRPVSDVRVELVADASVSTGRPRVVARMMDVARDPQPPSDEVSEELLERTMRLRRSAPVERPQHAGVAVRASLVNAKGESFRLDRPITSVGRALENDIVIPDARVSRFHAELRREDGSFVLRDLGSTNGTWVGEDSIDQIRLRDGETISLGGVLLTFRETD
jgi:Protein of unknown function (DUF3662)/FHA domain